MIPMPTDRVSGASTCVGRAMMAPHGSPLVMPNRRNMAKTASTRGATAIVAAKASNPQTSTTARRPMRSASKPPAGSEIVTIHSTRLVAELPAVKDHTLGEHQRPKGKDGHQADIVEPIVQARGYETHSDSPLRPKRLTLSNGACFVGRLIG